MSDMALKLKKKDIKTVLGWLMIAMSVIMLLFSIACFLIYSYDTGYSDNPDSTEDAASTNIFNEPLIIILPISALPVDSFSWSSTVDAAQADLYKVIR